MTKLSLKKETLDQFVKKGGYAIVEKTKSGWKGISEASRKTGLSRPTIYDILKVYPTPPNKTIPKYVEEWHKTEGYQWFKEKVKGTIAHYVRFINFGLDCWKLLHKKDPISWTLKDFQKLWKHPTFFDAWYLKKGKEQISYEHAISIRKWIVIMALNPKSPAETSWCARGNPLFSTKGLKRPKGRKKSWYLEEREFIQLINAIDSHPLLVYVRATVEGMGRSSSTELMKPSHLNPTQNTIDMFEPKVSQSETRFFHPSTIRFIQRYIEDYSIKRDQHLFPSYEWLRDNLKEAGKRGNITKLTDEWGATHILKHTGITQGALHGMPLEVLSEQSGTDPTTLKDFYVGGLVKKLRHHILGVPLDSDELWHDWIKKLNPIWLRRYQEIEKDMNLFHSFRNGSGGHGKPSKLELERMEAN